MGYYRSIKDNTVQVEAVKFDGSRTSLTNIRNLISVTGENNLAEIRGGRVFITTRGGEYIVDRGYWVVMDSSGEVFVSSPLEFSEIYEAGTAIVTGASTPAYGTMAYETASDYYTSSQVDTLLSGKADTGDVYSHWNLILNDVTGTSYPITSEETVNIIGGTNTTVSYGSAVGDHDITIDVSTPSGDSYKTISDADGLQTCTASGDTDTLKFRSSTNEVDIIITNDDATYGDNIDLQVNETVIPHDNLNSLSGGQAGEYNHLTDAELSKLSGIPANADAYLNWNIILNGVTGTEYPVTSDEVVNLIGGDNTTISYSDTVGDHDITVDVSIPSKNIYKTISNEDGLQSCEASGDTDTLKLRTANNILALTISNDDVTYGDNVLFTVQETNISHDNLTGIESNTVGEYHHLDDDEYTKLSGIPANADAYLNWNIIINDVTGSEYTVTSDEVVNIVGGDNITVSYTAAGVGDHELTIDSDIDAITFGNDDNIPYTKSTTDDFDYSDNFTYDGSQFYIYRNAAIGTWGGMTLTNANVKLTDDGGDMYIGGSAIITDANLEIGTSNASTVSIGINDTEIVNINGTNTDIASGAFRVSGMNNDNALMTTDGDGDFISETNLTFDGTNLDVTGNVLANQFEFDAFGTSGHTGIIANLTAGENLSAGDVVYPDGSAVSKADADNSGYYPAIGIALETINNASQGAILLQGIYYSSSHGYTGTIYLSTTAGAFTDTAPSTSNEIVQVLGHVLNTNKIYFNPSQDYYTVN